MSVSTLIALAFIGFLAIFSPVAAAQTVSIAPAEDPSYSARKEMGSTPMTGLVSGFMERLFDAGVIATDSRSSVISRDGWALPNFGLAEAREGFVDYLIAVYATWKPSAYRETAWVPGIAEYRVVRVSDGMILGVGSVEGPPDSADAALDAERSAASLGAALASACIPKLGIRSIGGE